MRLVEDDGVVGAQLRIALRLRQQDAVGHQLDVGLGSNAVGEADLIADIAARLAVQLLGDARGGGARGDAARLGVADQAGAAAPQFQADLGQLGGLAGAGLAADDDDLVLLDGARDLAAAFIHRQGFIVSNGRTHRQSPGDAGCFIRPHLLSCRMV